MVETRSGAQKEKGQSVVNMNVTDQKRKGKGGSSTGKPESNVSGAGQDNTSPKDLDRKPQAVVTTAMKSAFEQMHVCTWTDIFLIVVFAAAIPLGYFYVENKTNDDGFKIKDYVAILEKLETRVPELNKKVNILENEITNKEKLIRSAADSVASMTNRVASMTESVQSSSERLEEISNKLTDVSERTKISAKKADDHEEKLTSNENKLRIFDEGIDLLETEIAELQKNRTEAEKQVQPVIEKQTELVKTFDEFEEKVETMQKGIGNIENKMKEYEPSFENVKTAVKDMKEVESTVNTIKSDVKNQEETLKYIKSINNENEETVKNVHEHAQKLEEKVKLSENRQKAIKDDLEKSNKQVTDLGIKFSTAENDLTKYKENIGSIQQEISDKHHKIQTDLEVAEDRVGKISYEINTCKDGMTKIDREIEDVIRPFVAYSEQKVPDIISRVMTLEGTGTIPWFGLMDIPEIVLIGVILYMLYNSKYSPTRSYFDGSMPDSAPQSSFKNVSQQPRNVLDQIQRVAILETKICILSFYEETQALHRSLVNSALEMSKRGKAIDIVQFLVRKQEDLLSMPKARYIFVFVDFNERNVILENPGQDLGDKKVVTVQAAQKLGADVFVTYVRDKGSSNLFPGHLYNSELSAFTTHSVLKQLETKQRCFSVYDTFSQSQKEHIGKAIK